MLTKLRGAFTRNKKALAVLGVLAVGGLALAARKQSAAAAGDASTPPAATGAGTSSVPYSTTSYAPYDSTAPDLYSAIQPQLEALQQLLAQTPVPTDQTQTATPQTDSQARQGQIAGWYQQYLGRAASPGELTNWDTGRWGAGKDLGTIRTAIATSAEAAAVKSGAL